MTLSTFIPDNVVVFFLYFYTRLIAAVLLWYMLIILHDVWCKLFITMLIFSSCTPNAFKNTELVQLDTLRRRIFRF